MGEESAAGPLPRPETQQKSGRDATARLPEHVPDSEHADPPMQPLKARQKRKAEPGKSGKDTSSRPSKSASKGPPVPGPVENPFAKPPANPFLKGTAGGAADVPKTPGGKDRGSEAGASGVSDLPKGFLTSLAAEGSKGGAGLKRKAGSEAKAGCFKANTKAST